MALSNNIYPKIKVIAWFIFPEGWSYKIDNDARSNMNIWLSYYNPTKNKQYAQTCSKKNYSQFLKYQSPLFFSYPWKKDKIDGSFGLFIKEITTYTLKIFLSLELMGHQYTLQEFRHVLHSTSLGPYLKHHQQFFSNFILDMEIWTWQVIVLQKFSSTLTTLTVTQ